MSPHAFDRETARNTAGIIRPLLPAAARIGILTGTGLGSALPRLEVSAAVPYSDLTGFPEPTVAGHMGSLDICSRRDLGLLVFRGRVHLYEGFSPQAVSFPIRVMQELGVRHLVITNAAGGLHPDMSPGNVMVISDHINLTGTNPLAGPNDDGWGLRFPDMSAVYDDAWRQSAFSAGRRLGIPTRSGVYAGLLGPSLETPAEIRFLRAIGADAVGMSSVTEAIAGVHAGMRILGLSVITNVHDPERPKSTTVEEVIATAESAMPGLNRILESVLDDMAGASS
jgi:purine-nucleoside phosphorylase